MDIKKEREAFERLPLAELAIESEFVFYNEETNSYWPNEDFCPSDAPETMNFAWEAWQAAKAQAVPEGFVLVKKELPEQIAEKMAIDRIDKPRHENDPVWREIAEQSYKDQVKSKKWEFWRDYKAMIEAQEPTND